MLRECTLRFRAGANIAVVLQSVSRVSSSTRPRELPCRAFNSSSCCLMESFIGPKARASSNVTTTLSNRPELASAEAKPRWLLPCRSHIMCSGNCGACAQSGSNRPQIFQLRTWATQLSNQQVKLSGSISRVLSRTSFPQDCPPVFGLLVCETQAQRRVDIHHAQ
jgi:hypothetical protein